MTSVLRHVWLFLVLIQIAAIVFFKQGHPSHGIYNTDAFSYHVQWANVSKVGNPFGEPIVADADNDLKRIPFSMPHFLVGLTAMVFDPLLTYLIWCCLGVVTLYFSLYFFATAAGLNKEHAYLAALVHYTFYHLLSQLPPFSLNQLNHIWDLLRLAPGQLLHFGPRQYPHDIFFYPLLYTVLAMSLIGIRNIIDKKMITLGPVIAWGVLCLLLPFNYFYHWFQFGFALFVLVSACFLLGRLNIHDFWKGYRHVAGVGAIVLAGWAITILFQNYQLSDDVGRLFALTGGLTEARFVLLPAGLFVRIIFWSAVVILILRIRPASLLIVGYLLSCIVLMNMQLIVGKNIQPGHWSFGVDWMFAWALMLVAVEIAKKFPIGVQKLIPLLVIFSLVVFSLQSFVSWSYFGKMSRWNPERQALMNFLKTQPASVILAPEIWIDTDILIHTQHNSFLPRGAQSALSHKEQFQRISHSAFILGYSRSGFSQWLHIRSVRFFGMLYGVQKEFSSSYFYDPIKRPEILRFVAGDLPAWDWSEVEAYMMSPDILDKKLDFIVLHANEATPPFHGEMVFANKGFVVYRASALGEKKWGKNLPSPEISYPLVR